MMVRWLAIPALAALWAAFLLAGCSARTEPSACWAPGYAWDAVVAEAKERFPVAFYVELRPEQRRKYLAGLNAHGSPTGYLWERIGIFQMPGYPFASVLFGVGDCFWVNDPRVFRPLIYDWFGEPAPRGA